MDAAQLFHSELYRTVALYVGHNGGVHRLLFLHRVPAAETSGQRFGTKSLGLLKYPTLLLFAFILFFQSGFEGASGSFTPKFLEDGAGMAQAPQCFHSRGLL